MDSVSLISAGQMQYARQDMFSRIDTDGNGSVSKEEFVLNRPDGVSESQASEKFAELDSEGTGSLSAEQMAKGAPPPNGRPAVVGSSVEAIAEDMLASIIEMIEELENSTSTKGSDMFSSADTDGDGYLSEAEFIAARPEGVSKEEAAQLFASLDEDGTGLVSEEQMAQAGPPPGGKGGGVGPTGGGGESSSEEYDELDTNEDGVVSYSEKLAGGVIEDESALYANATQAYSLFAA